MIRRSVSTLVILAATFAPIASHAFPVSGSGSNTPSTAQPKGKLVSMTLKNTTNAPMEVLIEDKPVTIAANGTYALKAPEGTRVFDTDKQVKVVVTREMAGGTASFR